MRLAALGGTPVIVSSFDLSWWRVHVGVMRRSLTKDGSELDPDVEAAVIMTDISAGVGAKDIVAVDSRQ